MLGLFVIKNLSIFIVIIVLIVTGCLSEAMPFSLFNVVQILSIPFEETQAEKSAVVFIVLIVLFLCLMRRKFCTPKIKKPSEGDDMAIVTALLGFWHQGIIELTDLPRRALFLRCGIRIA